MSFYLLTSIALILLAISTETCAASTYKESLLLRPLRQSALLASFNFRSNTTSAAFDAQNFHYFPRALGQILQHAHTKELHLRFSTGRWDAESWGQRPWGGSREGGTGVELWAWVEAQGEAEADAYWLTLTNALSGLFCASLNFVDATRTIRPVLAFEPEGHVNSSFGNLHLLHGTLPNEVVCTENLTPFLKLLPCKGKAGVSSLLDGHKLFDASWQSMAIDVRPSFSSSNADGHIEMEQTIDMVLDIERSRRSRGDPIPRPLPIESISCDASKPYSHMGDSCFPVQSPSMPRFTIAELFGRPIKGTCPLSGDADDNGETVCVNVPDERQVLAQTSEHYEERRIHDTLRCYKMPLDADFNLEFDEMIHSPIVDPETSIPLVERTVTGRGQQHGGMQTTFVNPSSTTGVQFVYLESLPWFMKPHFHTIRTTIATGNRHEGAAHMVGQVEQMYYRPAVDRSRASHLELILEVPPASTLTLTYDFEKAILRYTEYPPDANRGFDVPPAIIRLLSPPAVPPNSPDTRAMPMYIRTTSLLLYLPTPDFSMPYNTIILTSTVIALAFGSIFNLLVRRFVAADEGGGKRSLKTILQARISSLRAKWSAKSKVQ